MKPRLVIAGAGLGGCFLADALAEDWDITIVELGIGSAQMQKRINDIGLPVVTDPYVGSELGGTTAIWHNGLIEIEDDVFDKKWPFKKSELSEYYKKAFQMLSGVSYGQVNEASENLKEQLIDCGIPEHLLGQTLFYPRERLNVWHSLKLENRVKLVIGEVKNFRVDSNSVIRKLLVKNGDEEIEVIGDFFVLSAGGLGTPILLQNLSEQVNIPCLMQAGMNYEDHPLGFVADFELKAPIYKLWNLKVPKKNINMRLPLVVKENGLLISFQLRPAVHFTPRKRVYSALNSLRNKPFSLMSYFGVLKNLDDVLDILSFKFGIHFPSCQYTLFMVAEQPPSSVCSIWRDKENHQIYRNWELTPDYLDTLKIATQKIFQEIIGIKNVNLFSDLRNNLASSAHFSGTARMSVSPNHGVCDKNGRVHDMKNLYVCDGSLIPSSGYANTGLTIAALALRMADHLRSVDELDG